MNTHRVKERVKLRSWKPPVIDEKTREITAKEVPELLHEPGEMIDLSPSRCSEIGLKGSEVKSLEKAGVIERIAREEKTQEEAQKS